MVVLVMSKRWFSSAGCGPRLLANGRKAVRHSYSECYYAYRALRINRNPTRRCQSSSTSMPCHRGAEGYAAKVQDSSRRVSSSRQWCGDSPESVTCTRSDAASRVEADRWLAPYVLLSLYLRTHLIVAIGDSSILEPHESAPEPERLSLLARKRPVATTLDLESL